MWSVKMSTAGVHSFSEELAMRQGSVNVGWELVRSCFGQSEPTLATCLLGLLEKCSPPETDPTVQKLISMCDDLLRELQELLGDDGVLLVPSHPTPALYHNQPLFKPLNAAYTAIFNILGVPATQVPLGLSSWGVPLGLQVS